MDDMEIELPSELVLPNQPPPPPQFTEIPLRQ